jgi:uncharacterized RDD family membrane protein YckC
VNLGAGRRPEPPKSDDLTPADLIADLGSGTLPGALRPFAESDIGAMTREADHDEMAGNPGATRPSDKVEPEPKWAVPAMPPGIDDDGAETLVPEETRALAADLLPPIAQTPDLPNEVEPRDPSEIHATAPAIILSLRVGGAALRTGASMVDALTVLAALAGGALVGIFGPAFESPTALFIDNLARSFNSGEIVDPLAALIGLAFLLSVPPQAAFGRSLGKWALGLRLVRRKTGTKPSAVRTIVRFLLFLPLVLLGGVTYFWMIVDREGRTLHDVLSGTIVVRAGGELSS